MKINKVSPITTGLLLLAGVFATLNAKAANDVWSGGGSSAIFSDANNWGGTAPVTADTLEFGTTSPIGTTLTNDFTGFAFPSITYDASGLGFIINGNAFTNGTSTAGTIITVNSTTAQTINNNITLGNNVQTISLASGNLTLGGVISGAGTASGITLSGGNTLTLSGANTYGSAGTTLISAGTAKVGNASAFGASRVNLANGPTIDLNGNNLSVAFINNSAALTGGIIDNVSAGGTVTLKVGSGQGGVGAASGTYTSIDSFSGIIKNTTGTVGLTKVTAAGQTAGIMSTAGLLNGSALLRLMNANTYAGPTTVNGGILELNFGQANNGGAAITANIISTSSALVVAGGDLTVDSVSAVGAQTFASLTLNAGASHLASYRNSSGAASLALGGITRNTGSTVDFQSRPSGVSSNQKIGAADGTDTTKTANANFTGGQATILGGYATYNTYVSGGGGAWAVSAGNGTTAGNITQLGTFNAGFAAGKDVDAAIGTSTPASMFINSLRFNTAGAYTVNTAGNITNATGGILETLTVGANAVAINNNLLTSGNGQDLIIHQYNTLGGMTIGANIVDGTGSIGLTKSGPGALTLTPSAANTFTGPLTLNAGIVTLGANALNGVPALVFGGMSQTLGGAAPGFTFANGTLNLNGNSVSVASLTASADSSGTALIANSNATPATLTVNGSASTSFTGTIQDGAGGGVLSLIKSGSGTQTIGGTLSYGGGTTVSAGTLALTTTPTATTNYAVNGTLNVTALTGNTLALVSPQVLSGSGTVSGSVSLATGAHTRPGATGVTNTITGNLTYSSGSKADFDLNTATNLPNDLIVLSGATSVLTCGGVAININLMGATLSTNDYVLFKLTGGSLASISGSFNSVPTWLGTVPANSGSYSIITDTVNKNVRLHYIQAVAPTVAGIAAPATVVRNQSVFISVTNTPGGASVTNAYLDLSLINGTNYMQLVLSDVTNVWTNTIVIPAAASVSSTHIVAYATDMTPLTGSGNIALIIQASSETWSGGGSANNWTTNENWVSVLAPGLVGDSITFDGSTQLTPSMDTSYSVTALTFASTASAFTVSSANSGILTLTGGLTNNSTSAQILNVPVVITTTQVVNAASGNISLGSGTSGGGLTKVGNNTLFLGSAANTFSGGLVISNGTVSINNNSSAGSGQITLAGGTFTSGYNAGNRYTVANAINVPAGNTGNIVMSDLTTLNGAVTGAGILNVSQPGSQNFLSDNWSAYAGQVNFFGGGTARWVINGGGFGSGFNAATVSMTNVTVAVANNTGGNTINIGAFTMDSTATFSGSSAGNNPLFMIGALNQNDYIAGSIHSSARITKTGSGNLTIASTSGLDYTGPTWVSGGTLTVLGIISASPETNYTGTVLAGTGTLFTADLEAGSTVSPGVSDYGTLSSSSDWTFNGGTNLTQVSTTNSDLIAVGGNLNLVSGTIRLVLGDTLTNGTYKLIGYTGTLTGSAGNLTLSGFSQPGQNAVLSSATANEIDLIVTSAGGANLIWASAGAQNNLWDVVNSLNWSNGPSVTYFTPSDHVTFNDSGAGNTTVDVRAIVQPSSMVVTGAQAYVFQNTTGGGKLSGATNSLIVSGTGSLELDLVNDYGGPTTIGSGSTLNVGNGAISASIGSGFVTNNGTLVFNQTNNTSLTNIVGTGAGTLTKNGGGTLTLTANNTYSWTTIGSGATVQVGAGGATGSLGSGAITNDGKLVYNKTGSFTVANINTGPANGGEVDFNGAGSVTLNNGNTYVNNTAINNGVVKLGATEAIPSAATVTVPATSTGWLTMDGGTTAAGTLDLNGFNQTVNALSGNNSTVNSLITNSPASATTTNTLTVLGTGSTTYWGTIFENTNGGAKIALTVRGANTLELRGTNNYSGGTIVGDTATLALHNSDAASHNGGILMSNGTTLRMNAASGSADPSIFPGNAVTIVDNASVTFSSQQAANGFAGTVAGSATATNIIGGASAAQVSFSSTASKQFQSLLGTVVIPSGDFMRWSANTTANGGDFTTFDVEGAMTSKNGAVSLGALTGAGSIDGGGQAGTITYTIGLKNADSTFSGTLRDGSSGIFSLIKSGTGTLTLSGVANYTGPTTVSNGVLALVEPVSLDSNATINVYSIIDVSARTDGTLNLGNLFSQTLNGFGTIYGSLNNAANSTVKVGLGTLNVTNIATLNGTNILLVNRTNAITHSEMTATSFSISGPLTVNNTGTALQAGDSFQLFNQAVSGFSATNLPTLTAGLYWTNKLAVDGSIAVLSSVTISANAFLSNLVVSPAGTLSPTFFSNTVTYATTEAYGNSPITVTATSMDSTATNRIIYGGVTNIVASGTPSGSLTLNANPLVTNVVNVLVTAQDGTTTKFYTVNVVRLPSQTSPHLTNSVSGNTLSLSWPLANNGYRLIMQTNNLAAGISSNTNDWMTVPGSTVTNQATITISNSLPTEFYQLVNP